MCFLTTLPCGERVELAVRRRSTYTERRGSAEKQLQCVSRTTSVVDHSGGRSLGLTGVSREICVDLSDQKPVHLSDG